MRRAAAGLCLAAALAAPLPAAAHPHIWIDHAVTLVFRDGGLAALRFTWTFDAMYSALLRADHVRGKGDRLPPEDVERLRKEAFQNLAGFDYFLYLRLAGEKLPVPGVESFDARLADGRVVYDFAVPISTGDKAGLLEIAIVDPEYYVAFGLAKENALRQEGGNADCEVSRAQRSSPFDLVGSDTVTCRLRR